MAPGVGDHVGSQLAIVNIVARIDGNRTAGSAAVVEETLDKVDSLGDGPLAAGLLVKDAERWIADCNGGLGTCDMLAVAKGTALIHSTELAYGCGQKSFVARAETAAVTVDATSVDSSDRRGDGEEGVSEFHLEDAMVRSVTVLDRWRR